MPLGVVPLAQPWSAPPSGGVLPTKL